MYISHMRYLKARNQYLFTKKQIFRYLNCDHSKLFILYINNIPNASAIVQENESTVEYFLGCKNNPEGKEKSILLLLYLIASEYKKNGYFHFYLGGGRSTLEDDSLLKFKKGIGDQINDYHIGANIYDKNYYYEKKN